MKIFFMLILVVFLMIPITIGQHENNQAIMLLEKQIAKEITNDNFIIKFESLSHKFMENVSWQDLVIDDKKRTFKVTVLKDGGSQQQVVGKIIYQCSLPVVSRPIGTNDVINKEDIKYINVAIDALNHQDFITNLDDLIGKAAKYGVIPPAQPIAYKQVKSPNMVNKGDIIDVTLKSANLLITTKAIAKEEGGIGSVIKLIMLRDNNTDQKNQKIFTAVISGNKKAEINHG